MRTLGLAATLLAAGLAGCLGGAGPEDLEGSRAPVAPALPAGLVAVTDAAGDATTHNADMLTTAAYKCRLAGNLAWGACAAAAGVALGPVAPGPGLPGPPQLDVLQASFHESAELLVVRVEVAALDEAFVEAALAPGAPLAAWGVCWTLAGVAECAYLEAQRITGPYSAYDRYTDACNPFWWCSWRIGHGLTYGEPGIIELRIPRVLVHGGEAGEALREPVMGAGTEPPVHTLGPAGLLSWEVAGPPWASGRHDNAHDGYSSDAAGPGEAVPLRFAASPLPRPPEPFGFDDPADAPAERPDADILRVEVHETPSQATVSLRMAEVRAEPGDLAVGLGWGTSPDLVVEAFLGAPEPSWAATARRCTQEDCAGQLAVALEAVPGTPGWLNLTFDRADLGSPSAGDLASVLYAWAMHGEAHVRREAGPARVQVTQGGVEADFAGTAPPMWFRLGTAAAGAGAEA